MEVRGRSSVVTCEILAGGQAVVMCVLFISFVAAAEPVVGLVRETMSGGEY